MQTMSTQHMGNSVSEILLVLKGEPQTSNQSVKPSEHIQLLISLDGKLSVKEDSNKTINFQLTGYFFLDLEDNKTLHFASEMLFLKHKILIVGFTQTLWYAAMALPTMNLSQISMDLNNFKVKTLELSFLAVFGRDCFLQTANESFLQKSRCFYGDADVSVNPGNYHKNYLEGCSQCQYIEYSVFGTGL